MADGDVERAVRADHGECKGARPAGPPTRRAAVPHRRRARRSTFKDDDRKGIDRADLHQTLIQVLALQHLDAKLADGILLERRWQRFHLEGVEQIALRWHEWRWQRLLPLVTLLPPRGWREPKAIGCRVINVRHLLGPEDMLLHIVCCVLHHGYGCGGSFLRDTDHFANALSRQLARLGPRFDGQFRGRLRFCPCGPRGLFRALYRGLEASTAALLDDSAWHARPWRPQRWPCRLFQPSRGRISTPQRALSQVRTWSSRHPSYNNNGSAPAAIDVLVGVRKVCL